VYDLAYYWPCYTTIDKRLDEDIMLFTTSKLSGHAGSRLGWAWIRDPNVAAYLKEYIKIHMKFVPVETQYRILAIWKGILVAGSAYFQQMKDTLQNRFQGVKQIFDAQAAPQRFSLLSAAGGFYLWIQCNFPADLDCQSVFEIEAGISGASGSFFGANSSFVRFNFALFAFEANLVVQRLTTLMQQTSVKTMYIPLPPDPYQRYKC